MFTCRRVPLMSMCSPERRYATYKAFYYPHTPASYEPPHFRPGDSEADQYFFSTHGKEEVPERWSIGRLKTGWHGWAFNLLWRGLVTFSPSVNVHVASVSAYLPSTEANDVSPVAITELIAYPFSLRNRSRSSCRSKMLGNVSLSGMLIRLAD